MSCGVQPVAAAPGAAPSLSTTATLSFLSCAARALDGGDAAVVGELPGDSAALGGVGRRVRVGRRRSRAVAERARHTEGHAVAVALLARGLVGDLGRVAVALLGFLHAILTEFDRHAHVVVARAQQRLQQLVRVLQDVVLCLAHRLVGEAALVDAVLHIDARGEQAAGLIDHAHAGRVQVGHAAGHQLDDGGDLFVAQRAPRVQAQHHRGGALVLGVEHEGRGARHGQVDAGRAHGVHRGDALHQLAFQAAAKADVLHELRDAQRVVLVHQFQPFGQARGDALGRQQHAGAAEVGGRDQHLARLGVQPVGDALGIQRGHHVRHRHLLARTEHRLVAGLVVPQEHHHQGRDADRQQHDRQQAGHQFRTQGAAQGFPRGQLVAHEPECIHSMGPVGVPVDSWLSPPSTTSLFESKSPRRSGLARRDIGKRLLSN